MRRKALFAGMAVGVVLIGAIALFISTSSQKEQKKGEVVKFSHIHSIAVDPQDPTHLYVATHHGLLRGSTDGPRWAYVGGDRSDFMGFAVHPREGKTLYSSGHPPTGGNLGVRKSTDGGKTWHSTLTGQVDFHVMTISPADPQVLYGWNSAGGLFTTTDGGEIWRTATAPGEVLALSAPPQDSRQVIAGTPAGLFVSRDQGENWEEILAGLPVTAISYDTQDPEIVYAYIPVPDMGMSKSLDGGRTWIQINKGLNLPPREVIWGVALDPTRPATLYVASSHLLFKSTDGGSTWILLTKADSAS